jgi:hypothetical protein
MMSSKEALSLKVRPWNISTGTSPIDSNYVNQKLLKPWNFPSCLIGTVNLVYVNFCPTGIVIHWIISEIISL